MVPHFGLPSPSDLLMAAYQIVKDKVFGISSEEDKRMQELVQTVQNQLREMEKVYAATAQSHEAHISSKAPDIAQEVERVATRSRSSSSSSMKSALSELETIKAEVHNETALGWKKINQYLRKVERMQAILEKLVAQLDKSDLNELAKEAQTILKQLKDTKLLEGIQENLSQLATLTESEAIPQLERELDELRESVEGIEIEGHELYGELELVEFSSDERERSKDTAQIDKLKSVLVDSLHSRAMKEDEIETAFLESTALPAEKLQKKIESYEKLKKELQAAVADIRSKFTDYKASIESRKQFKLSRTGFQNLPKAQGPRPLRAVSRNTLAPSSQEAPETKTEGKFTAKAVKIVQERVEKDKQIVAKFVDYLVEEKENSAFTHTKLTDAQWKQLQQKFLDFLKSHPGELKRAVADQFLKNNSALILAELKMKLS